MHIVLRHVENSYKILLDWPANNHATGLKKMTKFLISTIFVFLNTNIYAAM